MEAQQNDLAAFWQILLTFNIPENYKKTPFYQVMAEHAWYACTRYACVHDMVHLLYILLLTMAALTAHHGC